MDIIGAIKRPFEDYKKLGKRTIAIEDFRKLMGLTKYAYKNTNDLKRRVIDISIAEIKEKTPFSISYNMKKTGRVVQAIEFSFINKDDTINNRKKLEKSESFDKFRNFLKKQAEEFDLFIYKNKVVSYAHHPRKGRHLLYYKNGDDPLFFIGRSLIDYQYPVLY